MEITLKLFATLGDYLPHELNGKARVHNQLAVDVAEATTVQAVIEQFNLPPAMAHLVLVNGVFIPPGRARYPAVAAWETNWPCGLRSRAARSACRTCFDCIVRWAARAPSS